MPLPPNHRVKLVSTRVLTASVRELTFERTDGAPVVFEAGQWVQMVLPLASGEIRRSYSVASAPDGTPRFEIAVTHVDGGPGSTFLHALSPGSEIGVVGPQGFFTRPIATAAPSLFVATGTGVTPFRSMMRAALAANHRAPMHLLLGVRTEADILYRDEFERLAAEHAHVHFDVTLSRPSEAWPDWRFRGYVQTHVRALYTRLVELDAGLPHVYVCGLERMIKEVRDLVRKQMELPRQQVHSERYD